MISKNDITLYQYQIEFFRNATHYYIAGRFAVISRLVPVGANLLHHAIEMYLKGILSLHVSNKALRDLGHNLQKLWGEFRKVFNDPNLAQFDAVINATQPFEKLRYPDDMIKKGMDMQFAVFRADLVQSSNTINSSVSYYELVLEDIDHFVKVIFEQAHVNPDFYLRIASEQAKDFLLLKNRHLLINV